MSCPEIWLQVKLVIIFGLALALAIPSGFGRSRIRRPERSEQAKQIAVIHCCKTYFSEFNSVCPYCYIFRTQYVSFCFSINNSIACNIYNSNFILEILVFIRYYINRITFF